MEHLMIWHLSSHAGARLQNSTAHALEIGLAFRTHPVDMDYFLHGDKNIFSSSLQLLAKLPSD